MHQAVTKASILGSAISAAGPGASRSAVHHAWQARGVSLHAAVTEADVLDIVEEAGYEVRSVHFEAAGSSRVAYIRLETAGPVKQEEGGSQARIGSQGSEI